jgi:hypothetical protein
VHKLSIVIIAWIISPNKCISVTFSSKIMFLSVNRSKIIIMVSVVLIIRDDKIIDSSHSFVSES